MRYLMHQAYVILHRVNKRIMWTRYRKDTAGRAVAGSNEQGADEQGDPVLSVLAEVDDAEEDGDLVVRGHGDLPPFLQSALEPEQTQR